MPHTAPLGGRSLQRYILLMIVGLATCNANIISILKKTDAPVTEDDPSTRTAKEVHAEARLPFTISSASLLDDGAAVPILRNEDDVIGSKRADRIQMGLHNLLRPINLPTEKRTQGPYSSAREESAEELLETATEPTQNVTVMISGGFNAVLKKLIPQFYAKSGYVITLVSGPSMGQSAEAIPNRLARGEKADVVIMVGDALKSLEKDNWTQPGSRTELADSSIGMVVKAGDPWPDIRTVSAFRNTLLEAKSIAYSDSASGTYIGSKMFKKLGIEDQVKDKAHMIAVVPVASEVAKGNYALGFQQVSELLPVPGVELVGELPDEVQLITRYAGAVIAKAENQAGGKELLNFLSSPQVQDTIHAAGLRSVSTENSGNGCKSSYALNLLIILLALFTILHKECM